MSISVNLYQGGGLTNPEVCPQSLLNCEKRTPQSNGLGSNEYPSSAPNLLDHIRQSADGSMYPQPDWPEDWMVAPEAIKAGGPFTVSRWLDFRRVPVDGPICSGMGKGWNNQMALNEWYVRNRADIISSFTTDGQDVLLWTHRIPQQTDFQHLYWEIGNAQEGLKFDIVTADMSVSPSIVKEVLLADIDGSVTSSGFYDIPKAKRWRHDKYLKIGIRITEMKLPADPAPEMCDGLEMAVLDSAAIKIAPYFICPQNGR